MPRFGGTRFTKAATPLSGGSVNTSGRIIGANPRKQKLTEAAGTNPSKLGGGGGSLMDAPRAKTSTPSSSYAQNTAPHKSLDIEYPFSVGGPGFPKPQK